MKYKADQIIALKPRILANCSLADWEEIGIVTGLSHIIDAHPRLLKSLEYSDPDYEANIFRILRAMADYSRSALDLIKAYLDEKYPTDDSTYISSTPSKRKLSFSPNVFQVPECEIEDDLIAVMMPFAGFDDVYKAIRNACDDAGYRCLRADDIWENATIIQDIFNLIYRAKAIVVDFSNKNANVMYETGIAHTLGKTVIPISQSVNDIPSDMAHHRALIYLKNGEGCSKLADELTKKLLSTKA